MRISDWSSDVCSSDLRAGVGRKLAIRKDVHGECLCRRSPPAHHLICRPVIRIRIEVVAGRDHLDPLLPRPINLRSEEHTSELQSLMRISYAVSCLKKKNTITKLMIFCHSYH